MTKLIALAGALTVLVTAFGLPAAAGQAAAGHLMVTPEQLEWNAVPSLPPGAKAAVLEGDPSADGPFTMRIRFPAGYTIPLHTHPVVERVTVLEGTLYFGVGSSFDRDRAQALGAGALAVMDVGVPMYGFTTDEPAVIQINGSGPWGIAYLDAADDPRQASD